MTMSNDGPNAESTHGVGEAGISGPAGEEGVVALPLVEEQAHLSKREVETGRIRVRTVVDETETLVRQQLDTDHVTVTRVPIDRIVDAPPAIRTEGDLTIVPVLEEIVVVETKLVLKEEIHIRRTSTKEEVEHAVTLRKQRATVERIDDD